MSYLLDTNVVSESEQKRPEAKVLAWIGEQAPTSLYLSALTIGEIRKGVERLPSGPKRAHIKNWIVDVRARFAGRILPLTEDTFSIWGNMYANLQKRGIVRPTLDSFLEVTALEHDLILVTRNVRNFRESSVTILNPWED